MSLSLWMALDIILTHPRKPPPSFLWIFLWFHTLIVMASIFPMYLPNSKLSINLLFINIKLYYRSKCWFHLGSSEDLQVSVLWHCPEPSTLTLAKGSGSLNRSFLARFLAQRTVKIEDEKILFTLRAGRFTPHKGRKMFNYNKTLIIINHFKNQIFTSESNLDCPISSIYARGWHRPTIFW